MYHLELRQFPHSAWRFNLGDQQLNAIVEPWAREQIVEVGERKWSPHQAKITILRGPQLDIAQLSMGRGWRAAQRQSEDVTERVLAAAREAGVAAATQGGVAAGGPTPAQEPGPEGGGTGAGVLGDPLALGVQIAALLGPDAMGLLDAWRAAAASSPGLAPSESLALAEHTLHAPGGKQG